MECFFTIWAYNLVHDAMDLTALCCHLAAVKCKLAHVSGVV